MTNSPKEITVVPGSEHMLNTVNFEASQPNTIVPETRITIAISVFNTQKDSTPGTKVTRQRRHSFVAETVTQAVGSKEFRSDEGDLQSALSNLKSAIQPGS